MDAADNKTEKWIFQAKKSLKYRLKKVEKNGFALGKDKVIELYYQLGCIFLKLVHKNESILNVCREFSN